MLYAIINGKKDRPSFGQRGNCPACGSEVIAKCGSINVHHWAHVVDNNCPHSGKETDWHISWKAEFDPEWVEVTKDGNRADVLNPNCGYALEIQHSSISTEDILKRQANFKKVIWMINGKPFKHNFHIRVKTNDWGRKYYVYRRMWPRRSLSSCDVVFIDMGDSIIHVKSKHADFRWGWLTEYTRDQFIRFFKIKDTRPIQPDTPLNNALLL